VGGGAKRACAHFTYWQLHNNKAKMDKRFDVSKILPGSKQFEI